MANHSGMRHIDECSRGRPERKVVPHPPPLRVWHPGTALVASKTTDFPCLSADLIPLRQSGGPVRRIVVNRDSFRDLGFGHFVEHCKPLHGSPEAAVGS